MTENIDPNDIEDCQKQVFDLEAEVRELRAALAMYSKIDGDDGLASANRLLAACERGDGIDQHAAPDIMAARAEIVAQRAALERARALLAKWEEEAEQTGSWERLDTLSDCTDELAAALGSGGAA